MVNFKRTIKIVISLSLALITALLSACGKSEKETKPKPNNAVKEEKVTSSVTLPVAMNDTLDPFKAESDVNRALIPLLYDGLVYIDTGFEAQPLLAESFTQNGSNISVSIKPDAVFSDGSHVQPNDVVYSYNEAKKSSNYKKRLADFYTAEASGNVVSFTLLNPSANAVACLDFPIVKTGSVQYLDVGMKLYDIVPPTGSGRFTLEGKLPGAVLKANDKNVRGKSTVEEINLYEVSSSEGMVYGLEIGNYDYWYNDLSDGKYERANAGMQDVITNNLIFIGLNPSKTIFTDTNVRNAMSLILDRNEICAQAFLGHAVPTALPFNPSWKEIKDQVDNSSFTSQLDSALTVLGASGYTNINSYGFRSTLSLSLTANLLVCSDNEFKMALAREIKKELAQANFNIEIVAMRFEDYEKAIASNDYDAYIGEIKITPDMSLSPFFASGGAAYSGRLSYDCVTEWQSYQSGESDASQFCSVFNTQTPFIPLCYRCGSAISSRRMTSKIISTCYDGFYNINDWVITVNEII